jgi:hypothetical protein
LGLDVHYLLSAKLIFILFHIIDRSLKTEKGKKDGKRRVFLKLDVRRKKTEKDGYTNYSSLKILLMDTADILQFLDEVACARTGKHLNDLQRKIIEGILNRQKYSDIANTYGCTAGHAKDVGYELLHMLSDAFDEPVNKGNLESVLERQLNLNINFGDRTTNFGNKLLCL